MKNLLIFILLVFNVNIMVFDFNNDSPLENWFVVNDGVMGGLSEGRLFVNDRGHAVFTGEVSLENYGGFTSVRHRFAPKEIKGATKAVLRVKGDGKRYQFRAKTQNNDWQSYIYYFQTSNDWEIIEIPLQEMYPSFRGQRLPLPNFPAEYISSISVLIANKKAEKFKLEIDYIKLK